MTRLITQAEFAKQEGVSRQAVNQWVKNGRITLDATGLVDPDLARQQRRDSESPLPQHQARKAQFEEAKTGQHLNPDHKTQPAPFVGQQSAPPQSSGEGMPAADKLGTALKLETYKLQKAKAEMANLEIDKAAGALVERAEVDFVLADFGNALRGLLEGLPDRLSGAIAAHGGNVNAIHATLEGVAADLLGEISDHMKRKMEALA